MAVIKYNGKLRLSSLVLLFIVALSPLVSCSPMRNSRHHYEIISRNLYRVDDSQNNIDGFFPLEDRAQDAFSGVGAGAFVGSQSLPQQYVFSKRRKRELMRTTRKIMSAPTQIQMPAYYPFIMAEMIPGAVKTRHPSIIAVNGCPAYYIADHKGRCRQVFQYTVNFGQPQNTPLNRVQNQDFFAGRFGANPFLVGAQQRPSIQSFIGGNNRFRNFFQPSTRPPTTTTTTTPRPTPRVQVDKYSRSKPTASPRLVSLFRNAAKKFDLTQLSKKFSSNSGEVSDQEKEINKLREKILKALKLTVQKNSNNNRSDSQVQDVMMTSSNIAAAFTVQTTTADYDD